MSFGGFSFGNTQQQQQQNTGGASGGFSFGNAGGNAGGGTAGGFNFGGSTGGNQGASAGGGFNFGGNTGGTTSTGGTGGGFNFGGSNTGTTSTGTGGGGFNFGGNTGGTTSTGGTGGGFNFGGSSTSGGNTGTGGGFNFGGTSTGGTTSGTTGGGLNFGGTSNTGGTIGGGFNLGGTSNTGGTSTGTGGGFNFGGTSTGTTSGTTGGGFNFGGTSNTGTTGTGGGFNFGGTSTGTTSGTTGGGFNFGGTSTGGAAPSFNFNTSSTTSFGAPAGGSKWQVENTHLALFQSEMQKISQAYNPESPQCRFMFWLYNAADPAQKPLLEQKIAEQYKNIIHPRQFQEARNGNPDQRRFYAVPVRSFNDLTQRVEKQNERTEQFKLMLQSLEKRIEALRRHHEVNTISNIEQVKLNYRKLYSRVLRLMSMVEVMHQRGVGVGSSDIALKNKLQSLQRELQKPNQYRGRLNELIPQVNYHIQNSATLYAPPLSEELVDADTEKQIKLFFEEQTRGLKQLIKIVNKDVDDVALVRSRVLE